MFLLRIFWFRFSVVMLFICVLLRAGDIHANSPEEQRWIDKDILISDWFDDIAEGIDLFLVGKKVTDRKNETSVKLENSTNSSEGQQAVNNSNINVNLRLPNVEDYWQLKFTSYDENKERRAVQQAIPQKATRERNYGATVGVFRKLGNVRTSFQPRVELQNPLKVTHSLKFESEANMKTYDIHPKLEFFGRPDEGAGVFIGLNFDHQFDKLFGFSFVNDGEYVSRTHVFSVSNGFVLGQVVSKNASISYNLFFDSNNQPSYHLDSYTFAVGWNHMLYKKVLDYQVTPHLTFPLANNFKGVAGISLTVGLYF